MDDSLITTPYISASCVCPWRFCATTPAPRGPVRRPAVPNCYWPMHLLSPSRGRGSQAGGHAQRNSTGTARDKCAALRDSAGSAAGSGILYARASERGQRPGKAGAWRGPLRCQGISSTLLVYFVPVACTAGRSTAEARKPVRLFVARRLVWPPVRMWDDERVKTTQPWQSVRHEGCVCAMRHSTEAGRNRTGPDWTGTIKSPPATPVSIWFSRPLMMISRKNWMDRVMTSR